MSKCYICGKVSGLPETEYQAKFRRAEIAVAILGFEPLNPCALPHQHDKKWESYMREALAVMLTCDALYVLPDWQQSPGAKIEVALAKELNMKIIFEKVTEFKTKQA